MCKTSPREGRAAGDRNGQTVAPQPRLLCGDNDPNFFHTPRRVPSYVARHMAKPAAAPFVSGTNGIASCGERSSIHATDSSSALASWRGFVRSCRILGRRLFARGSLRPGRCPTLIMIWCSKNNSHMPRSTPRIALDTLQACAPAAQRRQLTYVRAIPTEANKCQGDPKARWRA